MARSQRSDARRRVKQSGTAALAAIATPSDRLAVENGELTVDGRRATDLVARFGSPLYVTVEDTRCAFLGHEQRRQNPEQCGFAAAIGSQ